MTEDEINKESFRLVGLITESKEKPSSKTNRKPSGSLDNVEVITNLKFVEGPIFKHGLNPDFSTSKIEVSLEGVEYGFEDATYPVFYQLVSSIAEHQLFKDSISKDFIESKTILWLATVYKDKRATCDLFTFLKNETEEEVEEVTFYYPVTNLHINSPFNIADVTISFFSKDYFDKLWASNTKKDRTEDEFNKLYRKYQGRVFASYTVKAESKRGNEIAFQKCLLAIDTLKLFAPTLIIPEKKCYMGIEGNLNFSFQADHVSIPTKDKDAWRFSMSAKNDPFVISDGLLKNLQQGGLNLLSKFILEKRQNDLAGLIIQAITFTSNAISTFDLHFRTAQLITIIESLLLEEERKRDMERLCKQRLAKLFKNEKIIGDTDIVDLLSRMYQVRHKIIHKAIRLPIDMKDLREFQILVVELIKRLTIANRDVSDKKSLIDILDRVS